MLSKERGQYPVGTVVRLKRTGEFAIITGKNNLMNRPDTFLNYYITIEGRNGTWAGYVHDFEIECLRSEEKENGN